jgi:hypothetical protein
MMRASSIAPALLAVTAAVLPLAQPSTSAWQAAQESAAPAGAAPGDAAPIVSAARAAIGGSKGTDSITSFVARGRTRQVQGDNLVPIEFEIACELPDRCIRRDEIPARESGPTTIGFNGNELVQLPVPPAGGPGGGGPPLGVLGRAGGPPAAGRGGPPSGRGGPPLSPEAQRAARLVTVKQDFTRLMLGLFVSSPGSFPVTFARGGAAEAPQGKADVLQVSGPEMFAARLFVFKDTHLPIMLTWQGQGPGGPAENRLFFADYRDVDGMKLPFRLRRAVGADTIEETTFDRYRLNAKIDPRRFEVRK